LNNEYTFKNEGQERKTDLVKERAEVAERIVNGES
jgi:hypothetical protein